MSENLTKISKPWKYFQGIFLPQGISEHYNEFILESLKQNPVKESDLGSTSLKFKLPCNCTIGNSIIKWYNLCMHSVRWIRVFLMACRLVTLYKFPRMKKFLVTLWLCLVRIQMEHAT